MMEIIKNISKSKKIGNDIYSLKPKGYWSNLSKTDNKKFLENLDKLGTKAAVRNLNKDFLTLYELQFGQFINFDFLSLSNSFEDENQLSKFSEQSLHIKLYLIIYIF